MTTVNNEIESIYPLSPMQQGMLFHSVLAPHAGVYTQQTVCKLHGSLDAVAFRRAWQETVHRHPVLRTLFVWERGNEPLQLVRRAAELPWTEQDWRRHDRDAQEGRLETFSEQERNREFDLRKPPLLRCALIRMADDRYAFVWSQHHLLMDGWCLSLVLKDVLDCYGAYTKDEHPSKTNVRPYQDYIRWLKAQDANAAQEYWTQSLRGTAGATVLGRDRASVSNDGNSQHYEEHRLHLSADMTSELQSFARSHKVTVNTIAHAAWALLLNRYSGRDDVMFGATVSGRPATLRGVESMVGLFINSLPVRVPVPADAEFLPWLRALQAEHRVRDDFAYASLVDIASWSEQPAGQPLFESLLVFENYPFDPSVEEVAGGLRVSDVRSFERTNYPLTLVLVPGDELAVIFSYDTECFDAAAIARIATHYCNLLGSMLAGAQQRLADIDMLAARERTQLLVDWNQTTRDYDAPACVHVQLEEMAQRRPQATALTFEGLEISYADLNQQANQLAHYLRDAGVSPEVRVGICVERSPIMVVAALAVLKAGGAYVPLDPAYPVDRLAFMLGDVEAKLLLTQQSLLGQLPPSNARIICLDSEADGIARQPVCDLPVAANLAALAYVIYTSGSTGRPKGVLVEHRGLSNLAAAQIEAFGVNASSRVVQFASFSFDASVSEFFVALCAGARLCLATPDELQPGRPLTQLLIRTAATHITLPPSELELMVPAELAHLQCIVVAGEACPRDLAARWSGSHRLINAYGPTEATVCATLTQHCDDGLAPSIGRPLANCSVYILDDLLRPVPVGVAGELHIGGVGLARGYQGQAALTAEKFIANPFSSQPGARLYRTGDLAQYRPNGDIDFLGRRDQQLKIRGLRIELGEVEEVLRQHPQVEQAVVVAESAGGEANKALTAYYKPATQVEIWPSIAEFYVYDDIVYRSMAMHESRNQRYLAAFQKVLKGKTVVEVGPGPLAILSRLALQAGARKVYAVELLESTYQEARRTLESLGLTDRIILIHGDATEVTLPEQVDYCISEIVGSIGGSEGAAKIINGVRRLLREPANMIPQRSVTRIAAINLSTDEMDYQFTDIAASYVERIFDQAGKRFDLRVCLKNLPAERVISDSDVFEDLDYTTDTPLESEHDFELRFTTAGCFSGFLVWLTLHTDAYNMFDGLQDQQSWLPIYLPLFEEGVSVAQGDVVRGSISRRLCDNGLNPDFVVTGSVLRADGGSVNFHYAAPHLSRGYRSSPFYASIFSDDGIATRPDVSPTVLREHLSRQLPSFMVPARFRELDQLPVSPNGKTDRAALAAACSADHGPERLPARDEVEQQLVEIWQSILDVESIGIRDDFFELGGHSLLAVRLMAEIHKQFAVDLPLASVFQGPTVEQLAALLRPDSAAISWSSLVAIKPTGTGTPLFCVPGNGGNVLYFNELARSLPTERPLYGLQAVGLDGLNEPHTRVEDMAAHYVEELRSVQEHGPYLLAGHSFGSWVAFEMAQQLQRAGETVGRVVVLDTPAPSVLFDEPPPELDEPALIAMAAAVVERMYGVSLGISAEELAPLASELRMAVFEQRLRAAQVLPLDLQSGQVRGLLKVFKANSRARYRPRDIIATNVTLIRAAQSATEHGGEDWQGDALRLLDDPGWGWTPYAQAHVELRFTPGDHITMLTAPHVSELAQQLENCLREPCAVSPTVVAK